MDTRTLTHVQTWELIPWLVNGSASAADRQRVEEHLRDCADCRDEYAFQQRLHAGMSDDASDQAEAQRGLARLFARIDEEALGFAGTHAPAAAAAAAPRARGGLLQRILVAALVVQTASIAAFAILWFAPNASIQAASIQAASPQSASLQSVLGNAGYRTLSRPDATADSATIRLVPAPTLSVGALQELLADAGLRIAGSSTDGTILGLAPVAARSRPDNGEPAAGSSAQTAITVARLRAQPGVLLAEPIVAPGDAP